MMNIVNLKTKERIISFILDRQKIENDRMENSSSTKMPKPFDNDPDLNNSMNSGFEYQDDDRLKQEDDYRQGEAILFSFSIFIVFLLRLELLKVQDEIVTLRQVLGAKLKREQELKSLLGMGFVDDLKHDWSETVNDIKSTSAFQKTAETFQAASDKIAPTLQTVNSTLKSRLGSLRSKSIDIEK